MRPTTPQAKRVLRPAETHAIWEVSEHLVGVRFGGPGLAGFVLTAPAQHIQVYLPQGGVAPELAEADGGFVFATGNPHPTVRTYTPRSFDPQTGELEVHFVVHGAGPGSAWASGAQRGDPVVIGGPAGGYRIDETASRYVIAGDETALPAIATLLEALPATSEAEVHVEVPAGESTQPLGSPAPCSVRWYHRSPASRAGDALIDVLVDPGVIGRHLVEAPDTRFWMAGEASASRQIRRYLIDHHRLDRSVAYTRAYWKYGRGGDGGGGL